MNIPSHPQVSSHLSVHMCHYERTLLGLPKVVGVLKAHWLNQKLLLYSFQSLTVWAWNTIYNTVHRNDSIILSWYLLWIKRNSMTTPHISDMIWISLKLLAIHYRWWMFSERIAACGGLNFAYDLRGRPSFLWHLHLSAAKAFNYGRIMAAQNRSEAHLHLPMWVPPDGFKAMVAKWLSEHPVHDGSRAKTSQWQGIY